MSHHDSHTDCDTGGGTVLRVVKWTDVFETWESRKHTQLRWISVPTGAHSSGYLQMIDTFGDRAAAIYGAWIALVKIAASAPTRGVLANGKGRPYSTGQMSRLSHFPASLFDELIDWATSEDVRWLEPTDTASIRDGPDQAVTRSSNRVDQAGRHEKPGHKDTPTRSTRPDQTRPNQTKPNQTKPNQTRQDQTGPSVVRQSSVDEGCLDDVGRDEVERLAERFRRVSQVGVSRMGTGVLVSVCCYDIAVRNGFSLDLAERMRRGGIRKPEKYARMAMRTACKEDGVDVAVFQRAVDSWSVVHLGRPVTGAMAQ